MIKGENLENPSATAFEEALAALEGGAVAIAIPPGLAPLALLVSALSLAGDHIVVADTLRGVAFSGGVDVEFVDMNHPCNVQTAIREETRAVVCEVLGSSAMDVAPLESVAGVARRAGVPLIVDNTFAPTLCRPFEWGADFVVYATTGHILGSGDAAGGAIIAGGHFDGDLIADLKQALAGG